jgi:dienelactone hydrolase
MSDSAAVRRDIRARMIEAMGDPPALESVPLDVRVIESHRGDGFERRKISYAVAPGDRAFAWLLLPDNAAAPCPAMLCLHQTTFIGKDEPAGVAGLPNLHYGMELAQRGHVTLCPDYPNFGDYVVDCYAQGFASATMKGIVNHQRAIDLLAAMDEVDADRIGVIGHSLGGYNTLFVAAFDERLRVAVSSCGFTSFKCDPDVTAWAHKGHMPRIAQRYGCDGRRLPFDFDDVLRAIAPRPVFVNATARDPFSLAGVIECIERSGHPAIERASPDCGHDFPPEARQAAYAFIDDALT